MKFWLLAILTISASAAALVWTMREKVIPGFIQHANEEMVADWHDGLVDYHKDTKSWPDTANPAVFAQQMFTVIAAGGVRVSAGYMHGRQYNFEAATGHMLDIHQRPMKVDFTGDTCEVRSSGADGVWGTADDVSSKNVTGRHDASESLAEARAKAEARAAGKIK